MSFSRGGNSTSTSNTINTSNNYTTIGLTGEQATSALGRINEYGTAIANSTIEFQRIQSSQATETYNALIGAARDFSNRAVAASTGQATPIEDPNKTQSNKTLIYLAVAGAAIAIYMFRK